MEKRTLLAIALSLLVLYFWSLISPARPPSKPAEITQVIENNIDTTKSSIPSGAVETPVAVSVESLPLIDEEIRTFQSDQLTIGFTNIGGGIIHVGSKMNGAPISVGGSLNFKGYEKAAFTAQTITDKEIQYQLLSEDFKITRRYKWQDDYIILASLELENISKNPKTVSLDITGLSLDMSNVDKQNRDISLFEYSVVSTNQFVVRKHDAYHFSEKDAVKKTGPVDWMAFRNRYFCMILKPSFKTEGFSIIPNNEKKLTMEMNGGYAELAPNEKVSFEAMIFAGPQDLTLLKNYGFGFEKLIVFSNFSLLDGIAKIIYWTTKFIHKIIPSWGFCIILISFLVYGATYPLTMRNLDMMRKMQKIQPELVLLKDKHKNNPQKQQKETVELYRKYNVNPLGGCLFFLLQMPVFIGLYQVLWRAYFFKGSSFLWIKDLAEPDRLFLFPVHLPVFGNEFNILPFFMAGVMFLQQKISSKNMVVVDPAQQMQQKMMLIFLPIMMFVFFYKLSSGLVLYFSLFYILSTISQYKMSKLK